jgi:ribonuclease P protein component
LRRAAGRGATNSPASNGPPRGPAAEARLRSPKSRGRLTRRAEFDAVYRNGRRRSSRQFTMFFAPNGLGECRFGMSVGRALGGAVVRNRIRRRIREVLRLNRGGIPTGWDIIVHPRASVTKAEFGMLREELMSLLRNSIPNFPVTPPGGEGPAGSANSRGADPTW